VRPGALLARLFERWSGRAALEARMREEMAFHVERQTEKNVALGMDAAAARTAALRTFGGVEQHQEAARDGRRGRWLEDLARDLRFGARSLARTPALGAVATLSLALGIGANTAIFSSVDAMLLKPLPYPGADRLVRVFVHDQGEATGSALSVADFEALREARALRQFGAYSMLRASFAVDAEAGAEAVRGAAVTSGVFDALRVAPVAGRTFVAAEDEAGAPRVALLGHGLWDRRFGRSPEAVGRVLTIDGAPHTVVGVMPPGFRVPGRTEEQLWVNLPLEPAAFRAPFFLQALGRLADGGAGAGVEAELSGIGAAVKQRWPDSAQTWTYTALPLRETLVRDVRVTLLTLLAAVALVLLIACANVANLLLARASSRHKELAVRSALGASRGRLARQLLAESLLVALGGAAMGVVLAVLGMRIFGGLVPEDALAVRQGVLDTRLLAFTAALAVLSGLAVGLVPVLQLPSGEAGHLREDGRGSGSSAGGRVRKALVVGELALALTVLIGAGLLGNSLLRLTAVNPGAEAEGVVVTRIALPEARYGDDPRTAAYFDEAIRRLAALPGARAAAVSMAVPPNRLVMTNPVTPEGRVYKPGEQVPAVAQLLVTPAYFETFGIPLRAGRAFSEDDRDGAPRVAIVNETMARRFYGGQAVGRWIQTGEPDPDSPRLTVVGVVGDVKYTGLEAAPEPTLYVPYAQHLWWRTMYVSVRGPGDGTALVRGAHAELSRIDPLVPVPAPSTFGQMVSESVATPRLRTALLGAFALVALLLACIGVYGVMSYSVTQQRWETGVRLALGATPSRVLRGVLGGGFRLGVAGAALGTVAAAFATRAAETLLFDVRATDPATFASMTALLLGVLLLACWLPARRAARTDPLVALRGD
jgi:putative ABC transport system permease protein